MATCACGQSIGDTGTVCWDDTKKFRERTLAAIRKYAPALPATIARLDNVTTNGTGGGTEAPVPFNTGAAAAAEYAQDVLARWASFIYAKRGRDFAARVVLGYRDLVALVNQIENNLSWLRCHPAAPKAIHEITEVARRIERACDHHPDHIALGPCLTEDCAGQLTAPHGATTARCRDCGELYDIDTRTRQLLTIGSDRLFTVRELSRILTAYRRDRVPEGTVNSWVTRTRLARKGWDEKGRPTYRLGDALDLLGDPDDTDTQPAQHERLTA